MTRPTALLFLFTIACAVSLAACQPTTPATENDSTVAPVTSPAVSAPPSDTATGSTSMRSPAPGETMIKSEQTYTTPAGEEKVGFVLFVDADGVVTGAETEMLAKAPTSVMRQKSFAAELPTVITGKKLSELTKIDRVGGSSLTTGAFNKALIDLNAQL